MEKSKPLMADDVTIAMIDDDEIALFIFHTIAKRIPHIRTELYSNAQDVIDLIGQDRFHPHIILLDINMPVMDGWEFLEEFEKLDLPIPVYIVSSSSSSIDLSKSKQYKAVDGFYCKPISHLDIQSIVDSFEIKDN
jgi:CheY-like chemotaxis protein